VFVRFDHVARCIVNTDHGMIQATAKLGVVNCIADCVWLGVPQATEWQRIGNWSNAAMILAGA